MLKLLFSSILAFGAHVALAQDKAPAGDPKEAHKKIAMCEGCHGIPGYKTAYPVVYHVPLLGGQSAAYLSNALHAYQAGQRSHPSMRGIAASPSEKDIADLAPDYSLSPASVEYKEHK